MARFALAFLLLASTAHAQNSTITVGGKVTGWMPTESSIREVTATATSLITINTRLRYNTIVILPPGDEILEVSIGDADSWVVMQVANMVHIKPSKEGATTNLSAIAASGYIYSFLLREGAAAPDIKVTVKPDPEAQPAKKFYTSDQFNAATADLAVLKEELAQLRERQNQPEARAHLPKMNFEYGALKPEKPFYVNAIWNDGRFTYVQSDAQELPVIYEVKDGKPSLVTFNVENGVYVVPKVIDDGYLALGRERLPFKRVTR